MNTKAVVLVVDHRENEAREIKKALAKKHYETVIAECMEEGMEKAGKIMPDVILLQAKLQKGRDAVAACRQYRKEDSKFRHIPILMMIDRDDYAANSLFENPRWSPFEALDGKPEGLKNVIKEVETSLNDVLKDTFIVLFGYYREDRAEAAERATSETHRSRKSA